MSISPTEYDKGQDTRLSKIEGLVTTTYNPPTGKEYSYPIVGQPLDNLQWQFVTLGMGSGILDEGGQPYWLRNLDNASDTAKLTVSLTKMTAQALLRGYYHRLMEDLVIPLPAVSATTTYYICLTYDPLKHSDPNGPINVTVHKDTIDTTQGKISLILWQVTRNPSQLLTDATVVQERPKVAPTFTVDTRSQLPDPKSVLWGAIAVLHSTGEIVRAWSDTGTTPDQWFSVTNPQNWTAVTLNGSYESYGGTARYRIVGGNVEFEGGIKRKDGADLPTTPTVFCWVAGLNFQKGRFFAVGATGGYDCRIETAASQTGVWDNLMVYAGRAGVKWAALDGIRFSLPPS